MAIPENVVTYNGEAVTYNGEYVTYGTARGGSGQTTTAVGLTTEGQKNLLWAEEFHGPLDMTTASHVGKWRPNAWWQDISKGYEDFAGHSWNINPNQHPAHDPFPIADSVVSITVKRTPADIVADIEADLGVGNAPAWSGGILVNNRDLKTFKYGYYEWRARLPNPGKGIFPALWMFQYDENVDTAKGRAEIDVFEVFGYALGQPHSTTVHLRDNTSTGTQVNVASLDQDTTAWHTYGLDWQSGRLTFYKDGVQIGEVTGTDAEWFDDPDVNMTLRLNFSMDADWFPVERKSDATTPDLMTLDVDYIRVYDNKNSASPTDKVGTGTETLAASTASTGVKTTSGSGQVSASASVTASGLALSQGTGQATSAASTTATGTKSATGTGQTTTAASTTATGQNATQVDFTGTGSASAQVSTTASGTKSADGTDATTTAASTDATGRKDANGTSQAGAVVSLSSTGTATVYIGGTGSASVGTSTTATGRKDTSGSASITLAVDNTAGGQAPKSGTAATTASAGTIAQGAKSVSGTGTTTIAVAITVTTGIEYRRRVRFIGHLVHSIEYRGELVHRTAYKG